MTSLKTDPTLLIHHLILTPLQDTVSKMILILIQSVAWLLPLENSLLSAKSNTPGFTDMPSSQPIDIPDAKKRNKKKKRCRATDSFSGRFEGKFFYSQNDCVAGQPYLLKSELEQCPNMSHFTLQMSTDYKKKYWEKVLTPECKHALTS